MSVVLNACRIVAVLTSGLILLMLVWLTLRARTSHSLPGDRYWTAGTAVYAVFALVQEAQQIGEPFVWWRLPLLLTANTLVCLGLIKRLNC